MDFETDPPELVIEVTDIDALSYVSVLNEGYSSEVSYLIRLRRKNRAQSFFNPAEKLDLSITNNAGKDFLTGLYIISNGISEELYSNPVDFAAAFFSCRIPAPKQFLDSDDYILEVKAVADLIIRPKPLSLLDPFLLSEKTETSWVSFGNK